MNKKVVIKLKGIEWVAVEKPRMKLLKTPLDCEWCDRQIDAGRLCFLQRQIGNSRIEHCAKLCMTCGLEKRGAIVFEPFICKLKDKDKSQRWE